MEFSKLINYSTDICWNGQGTKVTKSSIVNHNFVHNCDGVSRIANFKSYQLDKQATQGTMYSEAWTPTPPVFVKPSNNIIPLRPSFPPHIMPPFFQDDAPNCQTSVIYFIFLKAFINPNKLKISVLEIFFNSEFFFPIIQWDFV
jgi:hypothetical protein